MANSIRLFRGAFGHVSVLNNASDLVTHAHAAAHIIIWLDGAPGVMTVGEQAVPLGAGVAAGINAFEPHSHAMPGDGSAGQFLAFYIDPDWARSRRDLPPEAPLFACPAIALDAWLHRSAAGLFDRLCDPEGAEHMVGYEIERLIDSVFDAADADRPARSRRLPAADHRVRKAIEMLQANVSERLCLDEVARSVGLSRPHFFALFKEHMNLTPNVYRNTLRMEEAVRQLQRSEEPMIALAQNLGFTSQGNFTRFFRDHAGVPPSAYREAARATA